MPGTVNTGFILDMQWKLYRWSVRMERRGAGRASMARLALVLARLSGHHVRTLTTRSPRAAHGEPDAGKLARPVRRAG